MNLRNIHGKYSMKPWRTYTNAMELVDSHLKGSVQPHDTMAKHITKKSSSIRSRALAILPNDIHFVSYEMHSEGPMLPTYARNRNECMLFIFFSRLPYTTAIRLLCCCVGIQHRHRTHTTSTIHLCACIMCFGRSFETAESVT